MQREPAEAVLHARSGVVAIHALIEAGARSQRRGQARGERMQEPVNAGAAGARIVEYFSRTVAERRNHADSADRDPPHVAAVGAAGAQLLWRRRVPR